MITEKQYLEAKKLVAEYELSNEIKPFVKNWFTRLWERFDKFGDACINSLGSQIEKG